MILIVAMAVCAFVIVAALVSGNDIVDVIDTVDDQQQAKLDEDRGNSSNADSFAAASRG